jgi:hypothetical protein
VLVASRRELDGSIVPVEDRPAACTECGQVPEFLIVIVEPAVESEDGESGNTVKGERYSDDGIDT